MKNFRFLLGFIVLFVGFSIEPCSAQSWVKAGKAVSKQAAKALKSGKTKKTTVYPKNGSHSANGYGNYGRSAATAVQYEKRQCTSCSGNGWFYYNGIKYKCSSCSGNGYKIVRR